MTSGCPVMAELQLVSSMLEEPRTLTGCSSRLRITYPSGFQSPAHFRVLCALSARTTRGATAAAAGRQALTYFHIKGFPQRPVFTFWDRSWPHQHLHGRNGNDLS